ncbi:MAG: prepilin peptidase, partial [Longimicrobiales bacterium]
MEIALTVALILTVCIAAGLDVKGQTIPNWITVSGLVVALAVRALPGGPLLVPGLTGFALAFAVMLPLFGFGLVGGGDAKLLMVVGALLGPLAFLVA